MKILAISDEESKYIWEHFDREKFKDIDLIISCGDLKARYLSYLVTMIGAPLLYVHGNHDLSFITNPPEGCDNIDDTIHVFKGLRILGLGGSYKYNGKSFQYTNEEMSKRIKKLKPQLKKSEGFDILVTHAPAFGIGDGEDLPHRGFECFTELLDKYSPKYFLHGHQHLNYSYKSHRTHYHNNIPIINCFNYQIIEIDDSTINNSKKQKSILKFL